MSLVISHDTFPNRLRHFQSCPFIPSAQHNSDCTPSVLLVAISYYSFIIMNTKSGHIDRESKFVSQNYTNISSIIYFFQHKYPHANPVIIVPKHSNNKQK